MRLVSDITSQFQWFKGYINPLTFGNKSWYLTTRGISTAKCLASDLEHNGIRFYLYRKCQLYFVAISFLKPKPIWLFSISMFWVILTKYIWVTSYESRVIVVSKLGQRNCFHYMKTAAYSVRFLKLFHKFQKVMVN